MAEKINAKLGYRPVQPVEEEDKELDAAPAETFKRYEEELEINDFPQTARWKVTSKARPSLFMVALCNRADHYIFILFLLLLSFFLLFFPRLISAVGDWMSTILRHMVWP